MQIAVVGSGGWGTALAMLLHENRHEVTLISYSEAESERLASTLENPFLPGVALPADLHYTADPAAVADCSLVVVVPPSFAVRVLDQLPGRGSLLKLAMSGVSKTNLRWLLLLGLMPLHFNPARLS